MSDFEGGIRVNAFVAGGAIPAAARGTKLSGLVTLWDWYATFCQAAGVPVDDERAGRFGE